MMGMYTLIYTCHLWLYGWSLYFLTSFSSTPSGITCHNTILLSVFILETLPIHLCQSQRTNSHQGWYIRSPPAYALPRLCGSPPHRCQAPFPGRIWQQDIHHSIITTLPSERICWWHLLFDCIMGRWSDMWERRQNQNMKLYIIYYTVTSRFFPIGKAWCSCCSFWQMRSYESEHVHSSGKSIHATPQLWVKELRTTSLTLNPALSFFRMLGISQGGPGLMGLFPLFLFTSALSCTIPQSSTWYCKQPWQMGPNSWRTECGRLRLVWQATSSNCKVAIICFLQPHLWCQIISYHQVSWSTIGHSSVLLNDGAGLTVGASLDIKRQQKGNIYPKNIRKYQKFIQILIEFNELFNAYHDLAALLIACHACAKASRTNVTGARRNSWSKAWSACTR